jgi:hypothetical protein
MKAPEIEVNEPVATDVIAGHGARSRHFMIVKGFV